MVALPHITQGWNEAGAAIRWCSKIVRILCWQFMGTQLKFLQLRAMEGLSLEFRMRPIDVWCWLHWGSIQLGTKWYCITFFGARNWKRYHNYPTYSNRHDPSLAGLWCPRAMSLRRRKHLGQVREQPKPKRRSKRRQRPKLKVSRNQSVLSEG